MGGNWIVEVDSLISKKISTTSCDHCWGSGGCSCEECFTPSKEEPKRTGGYCGYCDGSGSDTRYCYVDKEGNALTKWERIY